MTHRLASVALSLAAALFAIAAPAHALVIDDFTHATDPTLSGLDRVVDDNEGDDDFFLDPAAPGILSFEGLDELQGSVDYIANPTPLNLSGYNAVQIDFFMIADPADDGPVDIELVLFISDGVDTAQISIDPLPFVDPLVYLDNDATYSLFALFANFSGIGDIDFTQITQISLEFNSSQLDVIAMMDSIQLANFEAIPAPAALPAGLAGLAILAARRRRRSYR